jgi:hypothetical protein
MKDAERRIEEKTRNIRAFMLCASSRAWRLCVQLAFAAGVCINTNEWQTVMTDDSRYSLV